VAAPLRVAPPPPDEYAVTDNPALTVWTERREQGRHHRRRYEPTWHLCQAFLAGRQWTGWADGKIREQPNPQKRERHTVNVTTIYHENVVGKLMSEDFRPDLFFSREDMEAEGVTDEATRDLRFLWETEVRAEEKIHEVVRKMATYGTCALRCSYDRMAGPLMMEAPLGPDGNPIIDPAQAHDYVAQAQQQGQQVQFMPIHEGKVRWRAFSPFHILTPPGVEFEQDFPWLILEEAVWLPRVRALYGDAAAGLSADSLTGYEGSSLQDVSYGEIGGAGSGHLRDHILLCTGFEQPTDQFPKGRVTVWAKQTKLEERQELPYLHAGEPHSGVVFFHYHKEEGRFWSLGMTESMLGPQRQLNRARSQMIEMKDRASLGRVYADKGTFTIQNEPKGKIMEIIEVPPGMRFPVETVGVGPGTWIENEAKINIEDMNRVAGLSELLQGPTPSAISPYASLALLAQEDDRRMGPIRRHIRLRIGEAVELSLYDVRRYWPHTKRVSVSGPGNRVDTFLFDRAKLPLEFYLSVSNAAPKPTTPAALSQMIYDIFDRAIGSGQPLPIDWLRDSLKEGQPLPIPKREAEVQRRAAELENLMLDQGQMPEVHPADDDMIHVQVHREGQSQFGTIAEMKMADLANQAGPPSQNGPQAKPQMPAEQVMFQMFEIHIMQHLQNAQRKAPTSTSVPQLQGGHGASGPQAQGNPQNTQPVRGGTAVMPQ